MKREKLLKLKGLLFSIMWILAIGLISLNGCSGDKKTDSMIQPVLGTRGVAIIEQDGLKFKDLNKNGNLEVMPMHFSVLMKA